MLKKLINFVLGLTFIFVYGLVELYPTIKMGARIYVNQLDFKSLLSSEPVAEYVSYLSDAEKEELVNMVANYCKNTLE